MDITNIPGLSGWPGLVVTIIGMLVYGFYTHKSVKSQVETAQKESAEKAEDIAKKANQDAISAMQTHLNVLRERINETEKENMKLRQLFETMNAALKSRGLYISVDGEMIHIHDMKGGSTTVHISSSINNDKQGEL